LGRFTSEEHILTGEAHTYPAATKALDAVSEWSQLDFFRSQQKVILRSCGTIDPLSITEAVARGAYRGAMRVIKEMSPDVVIDEVINSGLRGRGGAAFPTGKKWQFARKAAGETKYVVCNADEGEPGACMDRTVLEGDPHAILEGMLIGAFAIGAGEGFVYVRNEYPLGIATLQNAIDEAENYGLLGDDIMGSGWTFRVKIRVGAGAYICGEETALLESIEGSAGEPRSRPPYPVTSGLWGCPTVVNNVKTWASVAPIITRGADWYAEMGTRSTKGTTVFSLEGAVKNEGLVEIPFGLTLREMIYDIGGGIPGGRQLKAVQAGGAARGCIPPSFLDLIIDMEDRAGESLMIGTGGIIVLDDHACMVDMARYLVGFFLDESCGKCVPCREGLRQMAGIMDRICEGSGSEADLLLLERLAGTMKAAAVCGLGGMAPSAVMTNLQHFRSEFEAHIRDKHCPAGVCRGLTLSRTKTAGTAHSASVAGRMEA
jgi:NADH:ubiquinone oxidoreductase subunit F (NADH-binding)